MAVGSFSAALSGLNANSAALGVIGNNLANVNTAGFKASTITFQDLVYQNVGGSSENPAQVGLGVGVAQIVPVFSQGTIDSTRIETNAAIQGNGFFMLNGDNGVSYTRAGAFDFDENGVLRTPDGQEVQGYTTVDPLTNEVVASGAPASIVVPPGILHPPVPSTTFQAVTNLNAQAADGSTFTTSIQVFDALGASHITTMTYTKTGAGAWDYALTVDGADVDGGTPGTPFELAAGTLAFDGNGILTDVDGGAPANVAITTPDWANGATASDIDWQVLDDSGNPVLTGFGSASATTSIVQNGSPAGAVTNVTIAPDGTIMATVGSGDPLVLGQLALVLFNNPDGLIRMGSSRYLEGPNSGEPNVGIPGAGGRGTLIGSSLEQSNVDMAQEFTQMILAQRGYQANGKMITVTDQLLLETINLKQ